MAEERKFDKYGRLIDAAGHMRRLDENVRNDLINASRHVIDMRHIHRIWQAV